MVSLWYQDTSKQLMVKVIKAKNLLKTELVGKEDICKYLQGITGDLQANSLYMYRLCRYTDITCNLCQGSMYHRTSKI